MQGYLRKFNELYNGKTSIEIEFFNEYPFSSKYSRANQSGEVCYCMLSSTQANQKTSEGWKKIECQGLNCSYRQKKQNGPPDCKKIGWLKFLIPKIATDRIWLMKITSQQAVDMLNKYFELQREQGNSIKGKYILFLKKVENSKNGKTFNNFIIDIMKEEDYIPYTPLPNKNISEKLSTTNEHIVNNPVGNITKKTFNIPKEDDENKTTKKNSKKIIRIKVSEKPDIDKCYYFTGYHTKTFNKDGKPKEYFIGEFYDMTDKPVDFIVKPDLINGILECGIGSVFEAQIQEFNNKKILADFKFVQNNEKDIQKNIVA